MPSQARFLWDSLNTTQRNKFSVSNYRPTEGWTAELAGWSRDALLIQMFFTFYSNFQLQTDLPRVWTSNLSI